jgi:hypothetical protein
VPISFLESGCSSSVLLASSFAEVVKGVNSSSCSSSVSWPTEMANSRHSKVRSLPSTSKFDPESLSAVSVLGCLGCNCKSSKVQFATLWDCMLFNLSELASVLGHFCHPSSSCPMALRPILKSSSHGNRHRVSSLPHTVSCKDPKPSPHSVEQLSNSDGCTVQEHAFRVGWQLVR